MKLFAVEKKNCDGIEKKILRCCGLKIVWNRYRKTLKSLARYVHTPKDYSRLNSNFLNMLLIMSQKDDELLCIRTAKSLFVFPKKVLSMENDFIRQFLWNHGCYREFFEIKPLAVAGGVLLREHQGLFTNGNLIYKYMQRACGLLQRTIISQDEAGQLWSEITYLGHYGDTMASLQYVDVPKRKILDGVMLSDYVDDLTQDEKCPFLCRFLDWLFTEYATTDPNKVKGVVWDCYLKNFILNDEGFHLIDFDLVAQHDVSKTHCIYYICAMGGFTRELYLQLTAHFGLPGNWQQDEQEHKKDIEQLQVMKFSNQELVEHYFSPKTYVA
jgi:hypothetical protein